MSGFDNQLLREQVDDLMDGLSPDQKRVIELRFGFEDARPSSKSATAQTMSISEDRVDELEKAALRRLRQQTPKPVHKVDYDSPAAKNLLRAIWGGDIPE